VEGEKLTTENFFLRIQKCFLKEGGLFLQKPLIHDNRFWEFGVCIT